MSSDDPTYMSGVDMHAAFAAGSLLPSDLMSQAIARAELAHSRYNCFTETYFDQSRDAAKLADQRFADGTARPLEGLPLAVKEEFRLAGTRRTSSSLLYIDRVDDETDVYIQRLLDAGAIPIAKTTTPEFCILGTTHSRAFGVTRNPWNEAFTPGGSSGGSAVALATGAAVIATGSDIGGSIRIPASACGVVGYKPPYGRNPDIAVYNLDYYCQSGPLARSVADCALMQNVTSGQDVSDIASLRERVVLNFDAPPDIRDWRIAFSVDFGFLDIEDAVRDNTLSVLNMLANLGAEIEEVDLGWTREQLYASDDHLDHLSGMGLARLLDEHRGQLCDYTIAAAEAALRSTADGFLAADEAAIEMYRTFGPLLETYDAFICPGLAVAAPPAENSLCNEEVIFNGEVRTMRAADWEITRLFNMLSRCPVLNVPSGFAPNGVPTGIQIVAKAYHDEKVFEVGRALEQAANWYADPSARPRIEALP